MNDKDSVTTVNDDEDKDKNIEFFSQNSLETQKVSID